MQLGGWADYKTMREIYTHLAKKDVVKSETTLLQFFKGTDKATSKKERKKLKALGLTDKQAELVSAMFSR